MNKNQKEIQNLECKIRDLEAELDAARKEQSKIAAIEDWRNGLSKVYMTLASGGGDDESWVHFKIHNSQIELDRLAERTLVEVVNSFIKMYLEGSPVQYSMFSMLATLERCVMNELSEVGEDANEQFIKAIENMLTALRNLRRFY